MKEFQIPFLKIQSNNISGVESLQQAINELASAHNELLNRQDKIVEAVRYFAEDTYGTEEEIKTRLDKINQILGEDDFNKPLSEA